MVSASSSPTIAPHSKPNSKKAVDDKNKKNKPAPHAAAPPTSVLHSSVVISELPADMKLVYHRTVRQMFPAAVQKSIPVPEMIDEVDGATMIFEVDSKPIAEAMQRRLNRLHVYGQRWAVDILPLDALIPASDASVVDVTLNPPGLACDVRQALQSVQGFLAVEQASGAASAEKTDDAQAAEEEETHDDETHRSSRSGKGVKSEKNRVCATSSDEAVVKRLVAVFAEEGSAIHARAVLSGRLVGTQGSRMFLRLRRRAAQQQQQQQPVGKKP